MIGSQDKTPHGSIHTLGVWVALLFMAFSTGETNAQRRRSAAKPAPIDLDALVQEIRGHYQDYQWHEARQGMERYTAQTKRVLPDSLISLAAQIERAERMSQFAEEVKPIDSIHTTWSSLGLDLERLLTDVETRTNWVGFFRTELLPDSSLFYSYTTQLRRIRLESQTSLTRGQLSRYERIGGRYELQPNAWGTLLPDSMSRVACPFLMSDGLRILFAQDTPEGLGGYDLFLSRYRPDDGDYLRPTALGMPFNSPYNDYLLIYDEANDRTLLVSDRFCPSGYLVIYRFSGAPRALGGKAASGGETATTDEQIYDEAMRRRASLRGLDIPSARTEASTPEQLVPPQSSELSLTTTSEITE